MTQQTPPSVPPDQYVGRSVTSRQVPTDTDPTVQVSRDAHGRVGVGPVVVSAPPTSPPPMPPQPTWSQPGSQPYDPADRTPLASAIDATTGWFKRVSRATSTKMSSAYAAATEPSTAPSMQGGSDWSESSGGSRRVRLVMSRIDPWSALKLSFLLSFAIGFMGVVAATVMWLTLDGLRVFAQIESFVMQISGGDTASADRFMSYLSFSKTVSSATLVGVIDVFLLTGLGTIGAFLYNIVAALVGGLHVTMTDE
jgi:hypothetical protein